MSVHKKEILTLQKVEEWREKYGKLKPSPPQISILSSINNLCAFGLASGVVGIIFDLDGNHLSEAIHENVKLFDALQPSKLTCIFSCYKERGFYVGNNLGIVSKFSCRGGEEVEVTRILELNFPVVQISLSKDDCLLVVSTETRTVICNNWNKTFREVGEKLRQGPQGGLVVGDGASVLCARPGSRLWSTDCEGKALATYQYKDLLQGKQPEGFLDEDSADGKFFTFNKTSKPFRNHFFTKMFELEGGQYFISFNKKLIYFFDACQSDLVYFFERRFGEIVDVYLDGLNIYVLGASGTILKYRVSIDQSQETFLMTSEMQNIADNYFSSEEEIVDESKISSFDALQMEDFSASAAFLSRKVTKKTRKLLGKASHRIQQTKSNVSEILDDMYAESVEQSKTLRKIENIIAILKGESSDGQEKFLNLVMELDKHYLESYFQPDDLQLVKKTVNQVIKSRLKNEMSWTLPNGNEELEISPTVAEILVSVYSDNDNQLWNLDQEVANFVMSNSKIVNPDDLFESLGSNFYNTWSILVKKRLQVLSGDKVLLNCVPQDSNLTRISKILFDLDVYSSSLPMVFETPFQFINLVLVKNDVEYFKNLILYQPEKSISEKPNCETIITFMGQMVVQFSNYPDELSLLDTLITNETLLEIFSRGFFQICTKQDPFLRKEFIENIGFLILQAFILKKREADFTLGFCISTSFWSGFLHAMSFHSADHNIRWKYFPMIYDHANLHDIENLGYFSSPSECQKLLDYLISEKTKRPKFTFEDACFVMVKTIGVKRAMDILMEKSKSLPRKTFSARFYRHVLRLSLADAKVSSNSSKCINPNSTFGS